MKMYMKTDFKLMSSDECRSTLDSFYDFLLDWRLYVNNQVR